MGPNSPRAREGKYHVVTLLYDCRHHFHLQATAPSALTSLRTRSARLHSNPAVRSPRAPRWALTSRTEAEPRGPSAVGIPPVSEHKRFEPRPEAFVLMRVSP
uniref:Uncharacterized protein n=1 Tax=Knipowitschia caucasica TaxID=637954 RepID=A0AAV2K1U6_KNICA